MPDRVSLIASSNRHSRPANASPAPVAGFGGADAWALMLGGLAVGELVGGTAAIAWRPQRPLVSATVVYALWVLPLILLAEQASLALVVAGTVLAGIANSVLVVLWETTIQRQILGKERSRLSSFEQFGSLVFVPFGFLLGGWMEATIGITYGLLLGAAFLAIATAIVLALPSIRHLRDGGAGSARVTVAEIPKSSRSPTHGSAPHPKPLAAAFFKPFSKLPGARVRRGRTAGGGWNSLEPPAGSPSTPPNPSTLVTPPSDHASPAEQGTG